MENWGDKREGMAGSTDHPFNKYRQELSGEEPDKGSW